MATANSTNPHPGTVLLSVPATTRLEALSAVLAPLHLALRYRPDPRPLAPQAGSPALRREVRA